MSEESSGSLPHAHREVCVVICNGNDREDSSTGDTSHQPLPPPDMPPHPDPAEEASTIHNEEGKPQEGQEAASKEDVEEKEEEEAEDSQEQAMLPGDEEGGQGGGKRVRKDGSKAGGDRPAHQQLSATFGVTAVEEEEEELPFPGFTPKAFFYFHQTNPLRMVCLRVITNPYFERVSMLVILLNCITLGMYQPCSDDKCDSTRCKVLATFDHFIFAFFAAEMVIKMMAMGIFGKETYLADTWNRLDCFIVMAGTIEYAVDTENLSISAIRTIRVLRPLRAINRIPSMRILVMLLLDTLPMLGNVLLLCFFVFFIFGIIGVQLWAGVLRHRCFLDINESQYRIPDYIKTNLYFTPVKPLKMEYICSPPGEGGMRKCENLPLYEYEGFRCNGSASLYSNNTPTNDSCVNWNQYYTSCKPMATNPFRGAVSFDNIGLAWVVIFQVISLESWVNIMYYIQDAHSFWDWIYFVALIVIGSFFMINLCLVVIATQFSETKKRETERMLQERKRYQSCSTLASNSEPGGCYTEMLKLIAQVARRAKRKLIQAYHKHVQSKKRQKINPEKSISLRRKRTKKKGLFADNLLMDMADKQLSTQLSVQSEAETHPSHSEHEDNDSEKDGDDGDDTESEEEEEEESEGNRRRAPSNICAIMNQFQNCMKKLVESNFFQRSILVAILLNTLSMGVEYHNQPDNLTKILEYSNIVFCLLFATEMGFKILAYGAFGYISDGFNLFDGFIVILSVIELGQGGASGLSVLRTFRLLRILKLVRFMPALRRQLVVMLRTMDNVATFFALLVLFMFIFSILGMNLFGCKFCTTDPTLGRRKCDRKNFDSLLWAIITVFQVLTQEDWNTVLYNGMNFTSPWASLYFIALMTFGNYVLFNLLVAILVEGFSTEDEEKKREKQKEQEELEKQEKEKERQRLAENNNIGDGQKEADRITASDSLDLKNNKEKERKMLTLPPPVSIVASKEDNVTQPATQETPPLQDGPLNPPIITHTAATPMGTPMATPQGSPNESTLKDSNKLTVSGNMNRTTLSIEGDKSPTCISYKGSPRPSPRLYRSSSRGSWRLKNRRRNGDKTSLVGGDSFSDSPEDAEDDTLSSSQNSQSPTLYSPGAPVSPGVLNQSCVTYYFSDCNGHLPLNNQRTFSPQNSVKGQRTLTPKNSIKSNHSWSRNNSISSGKSVCNSFELSRQNSFTSHRTVNSLGSGASKEEQGGKAKNIHDLPDVTLALERGDSDVENEDDPDAIDETDWNCSWCPEPKGCFLERHEYSCYILHDDHLLRRFCHYLISRRWFDNCVLFFIALNCITLAMERPDIPPTSSERRFLTYANYVFTVVFTVEMLVKVTAKGVFVGKHAYLKSGWNVMDGFLVIISLVDVLISITANSSPRIFGILRVFRLLRTLRPLRVISRAPGLKLVVQTLLSSLRPIGNIVLICCTFFIIFGILGVQLFKGTFFYCKGPNVQNITNRTECEDDKKNVWINHKYNFDNLGQALMALFVLASKDGWVQIMYTGLDAVGVDQQPRENYNEWRLLYFISFLLLVGFFVLNMFVGVVVENFHKCRESQEKEERAMRAAKRQGKLEKKRKKLQEAPYWSPYSRPRLVIHTVISSKYFDLAIAGVIGLNVITMAMEYYMMPEELQFALKIFNYFFTSVFILEAAMKIVALGFVRYIRDRWNQLDILIVILSIVGIILEEMRTNVIPINPTIIRVMRVLRIARVLKLLKMATGIRALLDTVIQALPQVGNLGLLFFLLFFIFAALGVELFGRLECSLEHPCVGLSEHAHFKNFGMAFLTLFRVATGDNWNGIMKDTLREDCNRADDCVKNCCVSPLIAPVYFVVFVLMAQFVLVNVVVAVLMKHLEEAHHQVKDDEGAAPGTRDNNDSDTGDKGDEEATNDSDPKAATENSDEVSQADGEGEEEDTDGMVTSVSNQPPSFAFSVRPPSEEQSHHSDDYSSLSPARITITMETLSTPSHLLPSPGLLSPLSLSPLSLSPASLSPMSLSPHSPHLLSPGCVSPCPSEPGIHLITSPPLSPVQQNPRLMHLRSESAARRPLLKQYSMDMGSDGHLPQQRHGSVPNVWDKCEEEKGRADFKEPPNAQGISQSHPTLPKADSLDSDPGQKTPHQRFKQRLLRSRSSGAKYSRFKDKYKREKHGEDNPVAQGMVDARAPLPPPLRGGKEKLHSVGQGGSVETASDMEDSLISNWADEEAACDEEVKMITGEAAEDEDDVRPTLVSCTSSDLEDPAHPAHPSSSSNAVPDSHPSSLDCDVMIHSSTQPVSALSRGGGYGHGSSQAISPLAKSPCPSRRGGSKKARHHLKDPGIDNSSFDMGEEVRTSKSDSVGSSKSGTPASLKGRSPCNTTTPLVPTGGSRLDSVSPASVRQVTSGSSLASPATPQSYLLTPMRSPAPGFPGHVHVQPLTPTFPPGSFLQVPVLGQGLPSPQSPVPGMMQERHIGSPPIQRLPMCPPSPVPPVLRPQSLVVPVECEGSSALSDARPPHPYSLSCSPLPPPAAPCRTEHPASATDSSSTTALPLLSSPHPSSALSPPTGVDVGGSSQSGESLLVPVQTHPLQPSPIPPLPPSAGLPSSSIPGASSLGSPKAPHRTLATRPSVDRDCADSTGPR